MTKMISDRNEWLLRVSPCPRLPPAGNPQGFSNHSEHAQSWTEPTRVIYDYELVLFSQGTMRVEVEGKSYACPADTFIIIPPGMKHTSWNIGSGKGHRHWTHFEWDYRGPYGNTPLSTYHPAKADASLYRTAPAFVPPGVLHGKISSPQRAYDLHERIRSLHHVGGEHEKLASRALLLELLIHLLYRPEEPGAPKGNRSWLMHRVRERLKDAVESGAPMPPITVMLEEFHYTYAHLCRLFHAEYGIAPIQYVHALRISRAKLLMSDTSLSLAEIAYRVGFRDPAYFTQRFRKLTGMTPSAFRSGA
ncbi:MAG: AraC family transcriptional regulator [Kiritimatiellae bacterium]|nr:AraC family transcriptional regulator [Kiritimatiellia bacterium]